MSDHRMYTAPGGRADAAGVVVLHSWFGLTAEVRRICDEIAAVGYTAVTPDLYGGPTAADEPHARVLRRTLDDATALERADAALCRLHEACRGRPVGVIGFSMGAEFALELACARPGIAAVVSFYGLRVPAGLEGLRAPVQGHLAEGDEFLTHEETQAFVEAVAPAAATCELHQYPGASHGFVDTSRPESYDAASAALAWLRTYRFLGARLG
jgi:carboxymethylenebutenolidase